MAKEKLIETGELFAKISDEVRRSSQEVVASRLGISRSYLSDILQGKRGIGPKVFEKLGYEQVIMWRKK